MNPMMTNTDLTEEDAADLQFPKDGASPSSNISITNCANCDSELADVFILCVQCDLNICASCFANGVEFGRHKNDHSYKVMKNDFKVFEGTDWTAKEEMILLNGILAYNNWHTIAKGLPNRTVREIKNHYDCFYLKNEQTFPGMKLRGDTYKESIVPYRFRLQKIQDPIRGGENNPAGYNAARSDFEYDYDKHAEDMISSLETLNPQDPFCSVLSDLQASIVTAYRRRVWERARRRNIIREHGLIMQQKTTSWLRRYNLTVTAAVAEKLTRFMQFYTGERFEYMMEGLHHAGELKLQIARLCEYRKHGIKTLAESQLYLKLNKQRDELTKDVKTFQHSADLNVKYKNYPIILPMASVKRRSSAPLEILGMPGYDKITPKERDLCKAIRLCPENYVDLKSTLIIENNKFGFLKLLTARRLLKIDVNKTRKLYDFLIQEGYIKKPKD